MKEPASSSQSPRAESSTRTPKRRANSCVPCRVSKSRCNGGVPCSTCQKKRQKPRCYYRNPFARESEIALLDSEQNPDDALEGAPSQDTSLLDESDGFKDEPLLAFPHTGFYGAFSLARCVDEFKLLQSTEGRTQEIIDTIQAVQVFRTELNTDGRLVDWGSFEQSIDEPARHLSVLGEGSQLFSKALGQIYVKCLSVQHLLDSGMVAQAWAMLSGLVSEAELLGMDQETSMGISEEGKKHDTEPERRVWWLLVDLDSRLSFLLGRRPHISPSHRVDKPKVTASRGEEKELQQNTLDFSQYLLDVLCHVNDKAEPPILPADGSHALQAELVGLNELPSKLPGLPQNAVTDPELWMSIAARQIDQKLFSMVLHCQILREAGSSRHLGKAHHKGYYKEILDCARAVTDLFDSFFNLDPSQPGSCWPRCLGVYCAAAMLGIALLRQEIDLDTDSSRVERMLKIFQNLATSAPDSATARLVVRSLGEILSGIKEVQRGQNPPSLETCAPPTRSHPVTVPLDERQSVATSSRAAVKLATDGRVRSKRRTSSTFEGDVRGEKRPRFDVEPMVYNESAQAAPPSSWQAGQEHPYAPEEVSAFSDIAGASFSEPSAQNGFTQPSFPPSATTSFAASDHMDYAPVGYSAAHAAANGNFNAARWWIHPPMAYHPPMYDDGWQHQDPSLDMLAASTAQEGFFGAPSAPTMGQPHLLQDNMRDGQQVGLSNMNTASPSRGEPLMIGNPQLARSGGGTQGPVRYNAPAESYQTMEHALSSPGLTEGASLPDNVLGRLVPSSRRQSAADIRQHQQQQLGSWATEAQVKYPEQVIPSTRQSDGADRSRSPQRLGILSPVSEADSSRLHVVAAQGNPSLVQNHPISRAADHSQMLVPSTESENYPGSRRHSTTLVEESMAAMPERAPLNRGIAEAVRENASQQAWARQAQIHGLYNTPGPVSYRMDIPDYAVPYDQRLHGHLHPPQVIATGAFTADSGGRLWYPR